MVISRRPKTILTAYQKARLQAVSYRATQARLSEVLSAHELNVSQWIILGWLRDHPDGMRVTALADVLQVETPLVTTLIRPLQKQALIAVEADSADKRAKVLRLTDKGNTLLEELENECGDVFGFTEYGLKKHDDETYFSILERLVDRPPSGS